MPVWPAGVCSSLSYPGCGGAPPGAVCFFPNGAAGSCGSFTNPANYHQLVPPQISGWDCNVCVPPGQPILPPPPAPPPVVVAAATL